MSRWETEGRVRVSGGSTSTLTITCVSDSDAASYSVIVSNTCGAVTSSNAVLTVNHLPFIASQPQSQTVSAGSNVTFSVTVYGAPPFVFQWYCKGTPFGLPAFGTSVSSCTLTNVGSDQAGNYSVQAINGYGSVTTYLNQSIPSIVKGLEMFKTTPKVLLLKSLGTHGWVEVSLRFSDVGRCM